MKIYYFGVWDVQNLGHFLYDPDGRRRGDASAIGLPFPIRTLDGGLLPDVQRGQAEGLVLRNVVNGWTVLSFWDRSADKRPGSNSNFAVEGDVPYEGALALARHNFPHLFARFTFELKKG